MSESNQQLVIADDLVVCMAYALFVDGTLIDETDEGETLNFIQGSGAIIPGLEQAIYGLGVMETKSITVPASEAYGEYDFDLIQPIPITEFPEDVPLEVDLELEMEDVDGDTVYGRIVSVGQARVKIDFNHPLAGKDLAFEVQIMELRAATAQELAQGFIE